MDGDDGARPRRDRRRDTIEIHQVGFRIDVDEHRDRADMADRRVGRIAVNGVVITSSPFMPSAQRHHGWRPFRC
jgi:hypothetical protein